MAGSRFSASICGYICRHTSSKVIQIYVHVLNVAKHWARRNKIEAVNSGQNLKNRVNFTVISVSADGLASKDSCRHNGDTIRVPYTQGDDSSLKPENAIMRHYSLKRKRSQVDYSVVISSIWCGRDDHLECSQWLKSSQRDCLSVSVLVQEQNQYLNQDWLFVKRTLKNLWILNRNTKTSIQ